MKRKVYIVALNEVPYIPLVYGYLRVFCETDPNIVDHYSFEEPFFYKTSVEEVVKTIVSPSVVGLSCYVWNFRRNMKIARLVKKRYPNCLIVVGGAHIPKKTTLFFKQHPYVDIAVHGEGEHAFREILREHIKPYPDWNNVPGISYACEKNVILTGLTEKLPKTIALPSPYLLGYFDKVIEECHKRALHFTAPWETNRGCPYGCTFCDWGMLTMNKIRVFEDERLSEEIRYFSKKKIPGIFICDANFGILKRDVEIAETLKDTKLETGYPTQVRVNFAKNTNATVFAISNSWNRADMLMGTTIALQSNDDDVLEAIKRKNIKKSNFYQLQNQYAKEGIDTYTELILGLPRETADSFKDGVNQILMSNSHDDLRVYELNLLPNAPMNNEHYIKTHGIVTIKKHLFSQIENQPEDEIEVIDLVVQTNTLSKNQWIECNVFSQIIQAFHNGCYTRYISIFMQKATRLSYRSFYEGLISYYITMEDSLLGMLFKDLYALYEKYLSEKEIPMSTLIYSQKEMFDRISAFGKRRGWTVSNYCWLYVSQKIDLFYKEIEEYLFSINHGVDMDILNNLLKYQCDKMLQIDYDPEKGKQHTYNYDFPAYFCAEEDQEEDQQEENSLPAKRKVTVTYNDHSMGINNKYQIVPYDKIKFAKAAIGLSFPVVRVRHYQHQAENTKITYHSQPEIVEIDKY